MARLVLYALAALATRAYDWTTPGDALTPFDCDAYPNPIQVFKADNQNPPYKVGVALTATPSDDAGNLAVHPRTHKTVLSLARRSERNIRDLRYSKHDFGSAPLQLRFQVGDVVLARAGINASRRVP